MARARRTTFFAVVLFMLGGSAHLVHHIEDAACDRGPTPASHVCASCAGLHAGATMAQAPAILHVEPTGTILAVDASTDPEARVPARDAAPRAPPFA